MRNITLFCLLLILISCTKESNLADSNIIVTNNTKGISFTEKFFIGFQSQFINTIITTNLDTLYKGNISTIIDIPKYKNIDISYSENNTNTWSYSYKINGTVLWEDQIKGDDDFNDFVGEIQLQIVVNQNPQTGYISKIDIAPFGCYPKALGGTLPIGFGLDIVKSSDSSILKTTYLWINIREEMFGSQNGYINTVKGNETSLYNRNKFINDSFYPSNLNINDFEAKLFILVSNRYKFYINDGNGYLILNEYNFKYPKEKSSLFKAYPSIEKWENGELQNPWEEVNNNLLY